MNAVATLKTQIADLEARVSEIQTQCSHPAAALTKKHGASTGNYDPSNDGYWTEFHCGLCDKHWTEEGSK